MRQALSVLHPFSWQRDMLKWGTLALLVVGAALTAVRPGTAAPIEAEREYEAIKAVVADRYRSKTLPGRDLITCGWRGTELVDSGDPYFWVVDVIGWIYLVEKETRSLGIYSVAEPYLNREKRCAIRSIAAGGNDPCMEKSYTQDRVRAQEMARALNEALGKKRYTAEDVCGDGDIEVTLKLIPPNAKAIIISAFRFAVCQAKNVDPWDLDNCFGWREAASATLSLAGRYWYLLLKPDGSLSKGQFSVSERQLESQGVYTLELK